MNSKQRRKAERVGIPMTLESKIKGLLEASLTVTFQKTGPGKYTCGGHNITVRKRHEPIFGQEKFFFFEEASRICDDISEIKWTLEYEYDTLWVYVRDK